VRGLPVPPEKQAAGGGDRCEQQNEEEQRSQRVKAFSGLFRFGIHVGAPLSVVFCRYYAAALPRSCMETASDLHIFGVDFKMHKNGASKSSNILSEPAPFFLASGLALWYSF
jgi:hypothetical protein